MGTRVDLVDNRDARTTWLWIDGETRFIEVDPIDLLVNMIENCRHVIPLRDDNYPCPNGVPCDIRQRSTDNTCNHIHVNQSDLDTVLQVIESI